MSIHLTKIGPRGRVSDSDKPKEVNKTSLKKTPKKEYKTPPVGPSLPPLDQRSIQKTNDKKPKKPSDKDLGTKSTQCLKANNINEAVNFAKQIGEYSMKSNQFVRICTALVDSTDPGSTKRAFEIAENSVSPRIKSSILFTIIQHLGTEIVKKENNDEIDLKSYLPKLDEIVDYANTLLRKEETPQTSSSVEVSILKHIVNTIHKSPLDDKKKDVLFEDIANHFSKKFLFEESFITASKIPDNLSKGTKLIQIVKTMRTKNKENEALEMVEQLPDTLIKTHLKDALEKKMDTSDDTSYTPNHLSDLTNEFHKLKEMIAAGKPQEALRQLNQMDDGFRKTVLEELLVKELAKFLF